MPGRGMPAQNPDKAPDPRPSLGLRSGTFPKGSTMLKYSGHTMVPRCMKYDKLLGRPSVIILCDLPMCRSTIEIELSLTTLWVLSSDQDLKAMQIIYYWLKGRLFWTSQLWNMGRRISWISPSDLLKTLSLPKRSDGSGLTALFPHSSTLFLIAMKSHKTISDTGATRPSPWKAGG